MCYAPGNLLPGGEALHTGQLGNILDDRDHAAEFAVLFDLSGQYHDMEQKLPVASAAYKIQSLLPGALGMPAQKVIHGMEQAGIFRLERKGRIPAFPAFCRGCKYGAGSLVHGLYVPMRVKRDHSRGYIFQNGFNILVTGFKNTAAFFKKFVKVRQTFPAFPDVLRHSVE